MKSHPRWKRPNKITKLTVVAAATVKFTCFFGVDKVLFHTWALPGHWSECHLHRRGNKVLVQVSSATQWHHQAPWNLMVKCWFQNSSLIQWCKDCLFPLLALLSPNRQIWGQEAPYQMSLCKDVSNNRFHLWFITCKWLDLLSLFSQNCKHFLRKPQFQHYPRMVSITYLEFQNRATNLSYREDKNNKGNARGENRRKDNIFQIFSQLSF